MVKYRLTDFYVNQRHRPEIRHKGGDILGDLTIRGNLTIEQDLLAHNFYATGNYYIRKNNENYILLPAGSIIQSAAVNEPTGWFDCDGRVLSRFDYPELFNAIGFTYTTDSSYTDLSFNLPDFRGRIGVGIGQGSGLTNRVLGVSGGEEEHTLTTDEMPSHTHTGTTESAGIHNHNVSNIVQKTSNNTPDGLDPTSNEIDNVNLTTTTTSNAGNHNHTFTSDSTGGGNPHNNMQPFLNIRYLIKY